MPLAPGETYKGDQDGFADPAHRPNEVYKTVDHVNATVNEDGSIATQVDASLSSWQAFKSWVGQMMNGGWKSDEWLKALQRKGDTGMG